MTTWHQNTSAALTGAADTLDASATRYLGDDASAADGLGRSFSGDG